MPPKNICSCKAHNESNEGSSNVIKISSRKIKRKIVEHLVNCGELSERALYLCQGCASRAETSIKKAITIVDYFDEFLVCVENGMLNEEQLSKLAYAVSKSQGTKIKEDAIACQSLYKDAAYLTTFNCEDWLADRNEVLNAFLSGIGDNSVKKMYAMEQLYTLSSNNFIGPLQFAKNLMSYFVSGSKVCVALNSGSTAAGSYTTMMNWLKKSADNKIILPKDSDIVTFFDNNQKIERKWRVEYNFKSTSSVITTTLHFCTPTHIQLNAELSPRKWLVFYDNEEKRRGLQRQIFEKINMYNDTFLQFRNKFIKTKMDELSKNDNIEDQFKDMDEENVGDERYKFVESGYSDETVDAIMGEPCFENPCSYESVEKVIDHIMENTTKNGERHWTIIGCDGLPYVLGNRLMENIYCCPNCRREFCDLAEYLSHRADFQHDDIPAQDCRKYKDVIIIPGLGHYEINMVKALFKLLWDVCIIDLAKMLGFTSNKALASCQNCSSHHKSWQIIQIFMHAMAEEILAFYISYCRRQNVTPSPNAFHSWSSSVNNPNLKFMSEVVFSYCLSLHVFRAGVRRNNASVIHSGKAKFAPLFFGLNMPIYQEIFTRDSFLRIQCPPQVSAYIEKHESYSVSGNDCKGEGGDFVLEAKNKATKGLIPTGLPDETHWRNVCRNVDTLGKIRENINNIIGIKDHDADYTYSRSTKQEIFQFRKIIRDRGYLETNKFETLDGRDLDVELQNFTSFCEKNMLDHFNQTVQSKVFMSSRKFQKLIILSSDRKENLHKKTKTELIEHVQNLISNADEDEKLESKWKLIKNKKKTDILEFIKEIM